MNRYYLSASSWEEKNLTLSGEEARHAIRVMRIKLDEQLEIFDGCGHSAVCTATHVTRNEVSCEIQSTQHQEPSSFPITLCQAIPKGGNMELIIQKAVELGIHAIQPLITTRTVARPDSLAKKREKWQRIALEACKQCGQNYLPNIEEPINFQQWIKNLSPFDSNLVAALDDRSVHLKTHLEKSPFTGSIGLLVGPEGDLSPEEYNQAYATGFQPISFGGIIMRVETASIYGLSIIQHELSFS